VAWARGAGIEVVRGRGRLAGRGAVAVDGTTYTAEHVVVATGSDAAFPPVPGLRELPCLWTDREVTALTEVPLRLLVLGGGPIGVEMAQAVRLLGASVTVVQRNDHLLPREPAALGEAVAEARRCAATRLLVATGRRPRVEDIGLETVGITPDPRGIAVDGRHRAGPDLWAIGDVTGLWLFTDVGEYQGRVVASNIRGRPREADYEAVPRVVFCDPQAAAVGATSGAFVATVPLAGVPRTATYTRAYDTRPGFLTLLSDGSRLTGACALEPEAGEWLQQATVAVRARVPRRCCWTSSRLSRRSPRRSSMRSATSTCGSRRRSRCPPTGRPARGGGPRSPHPHARVDRSPADPPSVPHHPPPARP
jgi:pyruvate/2-oxoglutarate dehydrogenase complex dihydrolipoamide dehydrogenase (E3) component